MTLECSSTYSFSNTISHYSIFTLYGGLSLTSTGSSVKNCNYGSYGIFYLYRIQTIVDTFSTYENNTSAEGGIYYISGDTQVNK